MDPVCHTLVGAALGRAGLARRTRGGMAALLVGANLPDIDVLAFAWGDAAALSFRRGWTHGILALVVLPPALAGLFLLVDRAVGRRRAPSGPAAADPGRGAELLLLSTLAVLSHPLLDLLNVYGVRLLMPFSDRWFFGDTLFIVDPWLWLLLGGGVWLAGGARRRGDGRDGRSVRPARLALLLAAAYVAGMIASAIALRGAAARLLADRGVRPERLMVAPLPITPFERYVVYESGDRYGSGSLEAFPPRLRLHAVSFSAGPVSPLHAAAARAPEGRVFLSWARFPWFAEVCEEGRPAVRLRDARYPGPTGEWASTVVRPVGALSPVDPPATCSDSTPGALRSAPG